MKPSNASEQTIFEAARQFPDPQARADYLDTACAGDAPLREQIERLLQASQRADEFLASDPLGLGESGRQTILVPPLSEGPGTVIDNYKLLEKLGEGGFGVVYMAEQRQPIKRRVALKIIKVGMDTREVVARFEAERQALALMDHPSIAKIFDAGITERPLTSGSAGVPPAGCSLVGETELTGEDAGAPRQLHVQGPDEAAKSTIANREPQINPGRPYFVMELVRGIKITEPVVACPPSNLYKFQKLVRRNKLAFAAGAGIAAALVIGLAIALWQSIEKTRAYQEQARLRQEAQEEAAKSKEVVKFLKDILASAGPEVPTAEGCCRRMRSVVQLPWERRHPAGESPWFAHAGEDAGAPRFVVPKRSSGIAEAFPKPSRCS